MTERYSVLPLRVSENGRYLITENGAPFFWLGDTAWELFHRLTREEADEYLQNRAFKRFTVIQAVALAEFEGLTVPNAYGRLPLHEGDPLRPDTADGYGYWDHVDYIVQKAASLGLYLAMLPTWGDKFNLKWGKGPVVFTPDNARAYGQWLGARYRTAPNLLWVLGGDRNPEAPEHWEIVRAMAAGLKEGDGGAHLMTYHPQGGSSSAHFWHDESWLDFNMLQSGHGAVDLPNYEKVGADYGLAPTKPALDGEPRYEDHPIQFKPENGYFRDFDVRQAAYWAVFAGAFGHTYGHHSIWSFNTEPGAYWPFHWREALDRPGAAQMQHLRALIESRPFLERVPDQSLVANAGTGGARIAATRGEGYAFLYTPLGEPVQAMLGRISGDTVCASWYDPRTGESHPAGTVPNRGAVTFEPPSRGRGNDWVLVLDDAARGFPAPGTV